MAGCGGTADTAKRREAVDRYLQAVVAAERPLAATQATLDRAYQRFLTPRAKPGDARSVVLAERRLAALRARVRRLAPPADAVALHASILRFLDLEVAVAHDLSWMTRYRPRLQQALAGLAPAAGALRRDLDAAKGWQGKRRSFAHYCTELGAVQEQLRTLSAPPELRPALEGELATLRHSLAGCAAVDAALAANDAPKLQRGLRLLVLAGYGAAAERSDEAQRAAIRAYGRRIAELRRRAAAVLRERQRLQLLLG